VMEKHLETSDPSSCLNKAHPNEPLFVLRGQDRVAAEVVRYWVYLASGGMPHLFQLPKDISAKAMEALKIAKAMEAWPDRKHPD
jgi:hypothetical protein